MSKCRLNNPHKNLSRHLTFSFFLLNCFDKSSSMSFHQKFEQFQEEYGQERSLIVALSSINSKATNDLKNVYVDLLNSCCQLSRLHYIAHSTKNFTLDQLSFPLKGIQHLSVSTSIRLFQKPNHKDRFSYLVYYLREHPDIFAQVVYLALLTPNNKTLKIPDLTLFTEDDSTYFCFMTFPAMFNYFLTHSDQMSAVSFVYNIFSLHMSLHGSNFSKPHKFLSSLVSSLFLATNPGFFFELSVSSLVRNYAKTIEDSRYQYQVVNQKLVRKTYWINLMIFTQKLLAEMIKNVPLMPTATRFLITQLSKIHTDFPFMELFIMDAMICDYLENQLLTVETNLMRDVCNVIRCFYPQKIIPSPIYSTLVIIDPKFTQKIQLQKFISAFKLDSVENDPLSSAIQICEEQTLFTPRDLTLIFHSLNLFLKYADSSKVSDLANSFSGLAPPSSDDDDRLLCMKTWSGGGSKGKPEIKPTKDFDEIVDCFSSIDVNSMQYNSPDDLSQKALLYCGSSLGWMQKLRISNLKPEFQSDLEAGIETARQNRKNLTEYSDRLFSALFSITSEQERNNIQCQKLTELFTKLKLIPFMNDHFPHDFEFGTISEGSSKEAIHSVISLIDNHVARVQLSENESALLKRHITRSYLDQIDSMFNYQKNFVAGSKEPVTKCLNSWISYFNLGGYEPKTRLEKSIIEVLRLVHHFRPISSNLRNILYALNLMKKMSIDESLRLIVASNNISIFGFMEFIKANVIQQGLVETVFTPEEKQNIFKLMKAMMKFNAQPK